MTHTRKVTLFLVLTLVTMLMISGLCFGAEKYPTKPIQVIVPFSAGGSSDLTARTVEKFWTKYSPQPWLIVNKPGAGGVLGEEYVVRSKPDGYTIYVGQGSGHDSGHAAPAEDALRPLEGHHPGREDFDPLDRDLRERKIPDQVDEGRDRLCQ